MEYDSTLQRDNRDKGTYNRTHLFSVEWISFLVTVAIKKHQIAGLPNPDEGDTLCTPFR